MTLPILISYPTALLVIYFVLLLFGTYEMYVFLGKNSRQDIRISYRVAFYIFLVVLCFLREIQMFCTIFVVRVDTYVRVNFALQVFGDICFFACFMSLMLAFISALKLQYHTIGKLARWFSLGIFTAMCIVQVSLFLAFESEIQASIDLLVQNGTNLYDPAPGVWYRNVQAELELVNIISEPNTIYRTTMAVMAGFTILFALSFFCITLLVYFTLKGGDQVKDHIMATGRLTMTIRVLVLNILVTIFLVSRVGYVAYGVVQDSYSSGNWFFGVEFIISEVLNILIFLLFLYRSRTVLSSSYHSQDPKSHNSFHLNSNQISQVLGNTDEPGSPTTTTTTTTTTVTSSPNLDANQWIDALAKKDENLV